MEHHILYQNEKEEDESKDKIDGKIALLKQGNPKIIATSSLCDEQLIMF